MPAHPARQYVALILVATLALMQGPGVHVSAAGADETTQSALDLVRSSVARVHGAGHSLGSRGPESERVEIRRAAVTLFDVEPMSRRMLTRYWNDGSAQQQAESIRLRWVVYDILHDGVGLVSDHRAQFSWILRTSSFAQLLERMGHNEAPARLAVDDSGDVVRRLMLLRVVMERRGLR